MKKYIFSISCVLLSLAGYAQNLIGAWQREYLSGQGEKLRSVVIFGEGYQAIATYALQTGRFISSNGGTWRLEGNIMTEKVEFDSQNPARVGTSSSFKVHMQDSLLVLPDAGIQYTRIDDGNPGALKGAWLMTGRIVDGQPQARDTSSARKTMKILSGSRFQWIAYQTDSKQFMGTGGGSYTTVDGTYTEHIEFFSRDSSRVGSSLNFKFDLIKGTWHHTGVSSKGDPLNEQWSLRR